MPGKPAPEVKQSCIQADGLSVRLGGQNILHGIGFALDPGQVIGILGPNGSGKTTLLRTLAGLLPYTGTLRIDGIEVAAMKDADRARRLAFVRQTTSLAFDFSVRELILLGRMARRGWLQPYTPDDQNLVLWSLKKLDAGHLIARQAPELSGGELQRVMLAQALVQETPILLLDEPTAHLDVHHGFQLMQFLRELVTTRKTVITVYHDLEQAARFADQILVLKEGNLVAAGTPDDTLTRELVRDVFNMEAALERDARGLLRIHYEAPILNR